MWILAHFPILKSLAILDFGDCDQGVNIYQTIFSETEYMLNGPITIFIAYISNSDTLRKISRLKIAML